MTSLGERLEAREARRPDGRAPSGSALQQLGPGQGDHEDRAGPDHCQQVLDEVEQPRIGPLEILERQARSDPGRRPPRRMPAMRRTALRARPRAPAQGRAARGAPARSTGDRRRPGTYSRERSPRAWHGSVASSSDSATPSRWRTISPRAQKVMPSPYAGDRPSCQYTSPARPSTCLRSSQETRLPMPAWPDDRGEPRPTLAAGRVDEVLEQAQLCLSPDERRLEAVRAADAAALGDDPNGSPGRDRQALPAGLLADLLEGDRVAGRAERRLTDEHGARVGRGLEAAAVFTRSPATMPWPVGTDRDGRVAGQHRRPDSGVSPGPPSVGDHIDQVESRSNRPLRVVLVGRGRAPDSHDGIADELLDGAAVPVDDPARRLEVARQELAHLLGVGVLEICVKPTRSANSTDTSRRSATGRLVGAGDEASVVSPSRRVPHRPQNLAPGTRGAPQFGQAAASGFPHWTQKLTSAEFSVPHRSQVIIVSARPPRRRAGAGRAPRPPGGTRPSSGRRRSAGARRPAPRPRGRRSPGVGAAPSSAASVAAARIGRRGDRPERDPDVAPRAARRSSPPRERHDDLADRLGPPRADLAEAHLAAGRRAGSGRGAPARRARARSAGRPARSRRRRPSAPRGADRRRARRRAPAAPAACRRPARRSPTLPPSVPRFWIWAAPIVAAASTSAGRCSRQMRRAADVRVGRQRAEHERAAARRDPAQLVEPPQVEHARPAAAPSSPVIWTMQVGAAGDRPPGRRPPASRRVGASASERGRLDRRLERHASGIPAGRASLGGQGDRLDDLRVARAAAEVAGDRLADRVVVGSAAGVEVRPGGHRASRACRSRTARRRLEERLPGARRGPRLGRRRPGPRPSGRRAVDLADRDEARIDDLAVDEHRARAALALAAALLGAGQRRGPRAARRAAGACRARRPRPASPLTRNRYGHRRALRSWAAERLRVGPRVGAGSVPSALDRRLRRRGVRGELAAVRMPGSGRARPARAARISLRRRRQVRDPGAGRVVDRGDDGRRADVHRQLADALRAVRRVAGTAPPPGSSSIRGRVQRGRDDVGRQPVVEVAAVARA